ncbi:ABC transporter ATP-binding protein [Halalkalibacter okhensis]|uniref:ABC transporter n=1 Tax=Halalkalibacter okhensis TaxID=333138 RepID=A0A0B0IFT8_9BACI|nr:ABC transporter ATP-binding protein [Halalkalibacter okhensis]KHF38899.1 ABC transporter [Halalkalibacter okhensis]
MTVIEFKDITKIYRNVAALNGMSFEIEENKMTGVIGRNGAGKSTMLKILAGFLKETTGEIRVFSQHPFNNLKVSANLIFVDDQMSLPSSLTLREILTEASNFYQNWDKEFAERLFDYFSFHPKQRHNNLSKGMRSTFNMIIGLASRCPITIFDEPTTGMDEAVRKDFYRALLKDYIAYPRTILLSSHHLHEVEDILENVLIIKEGKTLLHLPLTDFKEMAIGFSGDTRNVKPLISEKEVFHIEENGIDQMFAVVKNHFTEVELFEAKANGVEMSPISSSDLYVYLTNKSKGGIDDVFNRA